jgi:hypothetical protein
MTPSSPETPLSQAPQPGLRRVLDGFPAVQAETLTTRTSPENGAIAVTPGPLENCMSSPTSPAVRRPFGA